MKILLKWYDNFRSCQLERKNWLTSEGPSFVLKNFHLNGAFHLHFNLLNRKICQNRKRPWPVKPAFTLHAPGTKRGKTQGDQIMILMSLNSDWLRKQEVCSDWLNRD